MFGSVNTGGHSHSNPVWPVGFGTNVELTLRPASITGTTDANGVLATSYSNPFSGNVGLCAEAGALQECATLTIKVAGFGSLGPGTNYALIGTTLSHPVNHYGTSVFNTALTNLATDYNNNFPTLDVIGINDMGLVLGGLFDINANWQPEHLEHREGRNADIRVEPTPPLAPGEPNCTGKSNAIPVDASVRMVWGTLCSSKGIICRLEKIHTCQEHYHLIQ